jgi:hypothetical protein
MIPAVVHRITVKFEIHRRRAIAYKLACILQDFFAPNFRVAMTKLSRHSGESRNPGQ